MTQSGGKSHEVGDLGQRYEVSVFDEVKGERMAICWTDSDTQAEKVARRVVARPSWSDAKVNDREKNR